SLEDVPPLPATQGIRIGELLFDPHQPTIRDAKGQHQRLTRGDTALLQALCRRPNQVLSRSDLGRASGSLVDPSQSRSIDMRMSRLRRLLSDLRDGQEAIVSVRGQGYQLILPVAIVGLDG
ncbi:MAG: winged helix-turn-helix domain-containing protein, partial [Prochlorococcaceae cyanobacterium]